MLHVRFRSGWKTISLRLAFTATKRPDQKWPQHSRTQHHEQRSQRCAAAKCFVAHQGQDHSRQAHQDDKRKNTDGFVILDIGFDRWFVRERSLAVGVQPRFVCGRCGSIPKIIRLRHAPSITQGPYQAWPQNNPDFVYRFLGVVRVKLHLARSGLEPHCKMQSAKKLRLYACMDKGPRAAARHRRGDQAESATEQHQPKRWRLIRGHPL
jgi:hypothetical protein